MVEHADRAARPVSVHPAMHARRIAAAISSARINLTTEAAAHRDILDALEAAGIASATEAVLAPGERIDVLCGAVGVEIKVGHTRRTVWRQLERYAAHDRIRALVLATGAAWPEDLREVGGKPLIVVNLSRGWL